LSFSDFLVFSDLVSAADKQDVDGRLRGHDGGEWSASTAIGINNYPTWIDRSVMVGAAPVSGLASSQP
jgi:hypothetical protein